MIDFVVCVREGQEPLPECAAALPAEARVVRGQTTWQARQEAFASSQGDVVAFIDPDVVVPEGWRERLVEAWESAPSIVAAIGGPLAARGDVPPRAGTVLGLTDRGDQMLDLDPLKQTLFAGNLSFSRRALRVAGGIPAPLDGRDALDWLAEEHDAQRSLARWGWLVRYEPALRAERIVNSRGLTRRRFRFGVRSGLSGARNRPAAVQGVVWSAAGAVIALARGSRGLAAERLDRAVENAGVVLSIGRRRQPATAPLIAAYTAPPGHEKAPATRREAASARPAPDAAIVLLYHRIAEGRPDPLGLSVAPAHFEQQLEVLREEFDVVPMSELAARVRDGRPLGGLAAITFDDGYIDNAEAAAPIFSRAGVPITLFAATTHIATGRRFFWDESWRLVCGEGRRPAELEIAVDGVSGTWRTRTDPERGRAFVALHELMQPRSQAVIELVLAQLAAWAGRSAPAPSPSSRPMTVDELRKLTAVPGVEIGAHTRTHVNLAHQGPGCIREEVVGSRDDVAGWTGRAPAGFSYPFGIPRHDVSALARDEVRAAGFDYAVVNLPLPVEHGADVYSLPRMSAPPLGRDRFATWLASRLR
jgi:peptidoglycan/xylan/chitin deacetylase (PgdA/CDA1 family)